MKTISENKMFGGVQGVYEHDSAVCGGPMRFAVFTPPVVARGAAPALTWLSGLTCTEQNFITKAGAQRVAAELGLIIVAPDTSPRGEGAPDAPDGAYDLGLGAGFYVDATEAPWAERYNMYSYVTEELQTLVVDRFPVDPARQGVFGHSMGGHGALTIHFKNPTLYRTASAFSPIVAPSQVPWGRKALTAYLGADEAAWASYDATGLVAARKSDAHILIDQGEADEFLQDQLRPELFEDACVAAGQTLTLRRQAGYDHSYYFIASFMEDHLRHHAAGLGV
ncbi:MAG: S-formylglutathione hydrolase [Pseudomonadota bacterium]